MADKNVKTYAGKSATVTWNRKLCIHAGECVRAKGELFDLDRKPWCDPDTSSNDDILDVITRCPTGALAVAFNNSAEQETAARDNTITVVYSGPLVIQGDLEIEGADEEASPGLKYRAALCRCGQSRNKPYCDNSHIDAGFRDSGAIGDAGKPLEVSGGSLKITMKENGPLFLSGNVRIVSGTGHSAWQGTATALCRCGMSKNKPFCDGTHRTEKWQSD